MLGSGTTSIVMPHSSTIHHQRACDVNISQGDDSAMTAKKKGVQNVCW